MDSFAHFDTPGQVVWNSVMITLTVITVIDFARSTGWSNRSSKWWRFALVGAVVMGGSGYWLAPGPFVWLAVWRWDHRRAASAHVQHGDAITVQSARTP
ncbi:MAG: hypothetical protein JWN67_1303 [Actinomycetia bacterium]|nr:hypothetical protein [Actinomycetes bacterium]